MSIKVNKVNKPVNLSVRNSEFRPQHSAMHADRQPMQCRLAWPQSCLARSLSCLLLVHLAIYCLAPSPETPCEIAALCEHILAQSHGLICWTLRSTLALSVRPLCLLNLPSCAQAPWGSNANVPWCYQSNMHLHILCNLCKCILLFKTSAFGLIWFSL